MNAILILANQPDDICASTPTEIMASIKQFGHGMQMKMAKNKPQSFRYQEREKRVAPLSPPSLSIHRVVTVHNLYLSGFTPLIFRAL